MLALGAVGAYAALQLRGGAVPAAPVVEGVEHEWGEVARDRSVVLTTVTVRNPNDFALDVVDARFDIRANGVPLGEGRLAEPAALAPERSTDVRLVTRVDTGRFLADWWLSHLAANETTVLAVAGTVDVTSGPVTLAVPVAEERTWRSDVPGALASALRTCPSSGLAPCIASSAHEWGERNASATTLQSVLVVRNPAPFPVPLPLGAATLELRLNGVTVAKGAGDGVVVLAARGDTEVPMTTALDHGALREWWPTHVARCERSEAVARVNLLGGLLAADVPLEPLETAFACDAPTAP